MITNEKYQPIILIGMTKAGKTTLGKNYALKYNLNFIDTDLEFSKVYNKTPEDFIKENSWESFRDKEEELFSNILSLKEYQLISTGGGIIERPSNLEKMLKYKYIIHIQRDIDKIIMDTDNSLWNNKIKETFERRKLIYQNISNYQYLNDSNITKFQSWLNNILT